MAFSKVGFHVPMILNKHYLIVRWSPPTYGLKVNVDGSSTSSSARGGGIVRDACGRVIIAFSNYYGCITNNEAEMRAVWDLLQLCDRYDITVKEIESDSLQIVQMLLSRINVHWKCN